MSTPVSIPTAPPSSIYTDARVTDPDDIWKVNLRKHLEYSLHHLVENVQTSRDPTLRTHLSENKRSRVQHDQYDSEGSLNDIRPSAEEEFSRQSYFFETSEHKWILDIVNSILLDVVRRQPWILGNIRKADDERPPSIPPNSSQNDEGASSTSPQQPVVSGKRSDGRFEGGYRSAGDAHEGGEPDGSKESTEVGKGDTKPRQPYDPRPYSLGQAPRSPSSATQAHVWPSAPIIHEHFGSVNSTGPPRSSAGLPHAESLDSDQYTHSDTEHLSVHNHTIVSNIPHRSINSGRRETPWAPLHSHSFLDDFDSEIHRRLTTKGVPRLLPILSDAPGGTHGQLSDEQLGVRHAEASAKMGEAAAQKKVADAKRKVAEAKKRETEAHRKVDEARRREREACHNEEMAKQVEEAARKQEEEALRKEEDAHSWDDDVRRRLEEARQREILARQREEEARRFEKVRKEEEARRKEDAVRRREEEERMPRPAQEKPTRHAVGSFRHERHEAREADDAASSRFEATKATDTTNRSAADSAAPRHKYQSNVQVRVQTTWQRERALEEQRRRQLEEQHRLEEQARLDREDLTKRQRQQEEQILIDEKLSRQEQARLDYEAFVEQEWEREELILDEELIREEREREANRLRADQHQRHLAALAEEERYRPSKEQHRKVGERSHLRDRAPQQHQWQQREIVRQHGKDEQTEFGRKVVEPYRRTTERNNTGAALGTSAPRRPPIPASAFAGNRAGVLPKLSPTLSNTRWRMPRSDEERIEVGGNRGDPSGATKGVSQAGSKSEEEEWARRTEERARQQQEQFKREQLEQRERERQVKNLNTNFVSEKRSTDGAGARTRATERSTVTNQGGTTSRGLLQRLLAPNDRRIQ